MVAVNMSVAEQNSFDRCSEDRGRRVADDCRGPVTEKRPSAFLGDVFGEAVSAERRLAIFTLPDRRTRHFADLADIDAYCEHTSDQGQETFFGLGLVRGTPQGRGTAEDVAAIGGLWCDIDRAGPAHPDKPLPVTMEEVEGLLSELPLSPSIIVDSGHGAHAYWLFREVWLFEDDADRQKAAALARGWHGLVCRLAETKGWKLENLSDLARVLRVPGTVNHKVPDHPVAVRILRYDATLRYNPSDFEPFVTVDDLSPQAAPPVVAGDLILRPDASPPAQRMIEAAAVSTKFVETWNRKRSDLLDQSQSAYDLSLATIAAVLGWSDQEMADLVIAARRKHNEKPEKALRRDYMVRTLERARKAAAEMSAEGADVDLSGIMGQDEPREEATEPAAVNPGPVPDRLLYVPGFIGEMIDFCLAAAPYPSLGMAFCGALAMLGHLTGRKVRDPSDLRTNLYLLALASSSAGKNYPRQMNSHLAMVADLAETIRIRFASGEGIEDRLEEHPSTMYQTDEIDGILQSISKSKDARFESIITTLLTMFSSANMMYPMRSKAGKQSSSIIHQPHLTIFGTATPGHYYEALSDRMLTNGLFARMIIVDTGKRAPGQDARPVSEMPRRLVDTACWWAEFRPGERRGNLLDFCPQPIIVPYSDDGKRAADEFRRFADERYSEAEDCGDEVATTVWGRANENARKLALIYACSENHALPQISKAAIEWAMAFVEHQTRRMLFMAGQYVSSNDFDALCKRAIRTLRQWHAKEGPQALLPAWKFRRQLSLHPTAFKDVMFELDQRRQAVFDSEPGKTKPRQGYRLL
ncbi:MAG: DUF3987 domain-containing protein [Phycisphaerae bacterium]|nr:DUF3987 domain-containing protein [Phycisphaerae bacterium]